MRSIVKYIAIPAIVLAAACQGKDDAKLDDSLSRDLALASQVQPPQQFVSPQEMGYNGYAYGQPQQYQVAQRGGYYQTAPVYSAPAPVRRTSSSSSARRSSGTTVAREPVRNTKRDAVIGAVGGAAVGAVTSRDTVNGAIIGAAAGGILGGIIGHTVDTH